MSEAAAARTHVLESAWCCGGGSGKCAACVAFCVVCACARERVLMRACVRGQASRMPHVCVPEQPAWAPRFRPYKMFSHECGGRSHRRAWTDSRSDVAVASGRPAHARTELHARAQNCTRAHIAHAPLTKSCIAEMVAAGTSAYHSCRCRSGARQSHGRFGLDYRIPCGMVSHQ